MASGESEGFGVRVLVDGAWGFASSHVLTAAEADRVAAEAVRIARASATALRNRTRLDDRPPAHGTYETPLERGPVRRPARDQDRRPPRRRPGRLRPSRASPSPSRCYAAQREWKTFAATDGSLTEQAITHVGAAVEANAIDGDEHQRRSYPDSGGGWQAAGYEFIRGLDLAEQRRAARRRGRRSS